MVRLISVAAGVAAAFVLSAAAANAQPIELDKSGVAALTGWLGEGRIKLNNIYTKTEGDTATDFHEAVNGKGRTITLINATGDDGRSWLIGGYNPQSWDSNGGFHMTPDDKERTAFLFNLTSERIFRQTLVTHILDTVGSYQTYNDEKFGPTFGLGHDLFVQEDLQAGSSVLYSYVESDGTGVNQSILDGGYTGGHITIGAMEVYSIAVVPEPGTYAMLGTGVLLLAWRVRRRQADC